MSTKPIREALELVQCTCVDHLCVGCKAEAAVSEIERAAKAVVNGGGLRDLWDHGEQEEADTLESIAKDAP